MNHCCHLNPGILKAQDRHKRATCHIWASKYRHKEVPCASSCRFRNGTVLNPVGCCLEVLPYRPGGIRCIDSTTKMRGSCRVASHVAAWIVCRTSSSDAVSKHRCLEVT